MITRLFTRPACTDNALIRCHTLLTSPLDRIETVGTHYQGQQQHSTFASSHCRSHIVQVACKHILPPASAVRKDDPGHHRGDHRRGFDLVRVQAGIRCVFLSLPSLPSTWQRAHIDLVSSLSGGSGASDGANAGRVGAKTGAGPTKETAAAKAWRDARAERERELRRRKQDLLEAARR